MKRIVVTGMGMIHALGHDKGSFDAIVRGECGVDSITLCPTEGLSTTIAAEVKGFDPLSVMKKKDVKKADRFIQLGLHAAQEAYSDAGLADVDCSEFGVVSANGMAGIASVEAACDKKHETHLRHTTPFLVPSYIPNMLGGNVSIRFGMTGPNLSVTTACAAGTHAIIEAYKTLQFGQCEGMLVVGADAAITPLAMVGFGAMNALSKRNDDPKGASRPFDSGRDGFVMGEGAGALVIETLEHARKRGATIYAEVTGFGESGDAHHITTPHSESSGAKKAIMHALKMAGLEGVDYVNAHGTSTRYNDLYEAAAIAQTLGEATPVSSTKGQIGHCLGAAGAIEAVITIMSLRENVIPPIINYVASEEEMASVNLVENKAQKRSLQTAMSCNFGFGGTNAAVIFSKFVAE